MQIEFRVRASQIQSQGHKIGRIKRQTEYVSIMIMWDRGTLSLTLTLQCSSSADEAGRYLIIPKESSKVRVRFG